MLALILNITLVRSCPLHVFLIAITGMTAATFTRASVALDVLALDGIQ
jgi:hypothetical protein